MLPEMSSRLSGLLKLAGLSLGWQNGYSRRQFRVVRAQPAATAHHYVSEDFL